MHKHPRLALATAVVVALTGGLLTASVGLSSATPVAGGNGDFDGDGYSDVAVAASGAAVNGLGGAGAVSVLFGGSNGAGAERIQTVNQDSSGVPGTAEQGDGFGVAISAADFNGDGFSDLAVGASGEDKGSDVDGGTVTILWGSPKGLSGGTTVADPAGSSHDYFGILLAAGDYNGDGRDDLAIGADTERIDVYRGGLTQAGGTGGRYTVTSPTLQVEGLDMFNLTPGDVNRDGRTDLLVDGFENDSTGEWSFNSNYYLPGSASGITTSGKVKLPAGVISDIGDANGDGYGDIVIGNEWDVADDSSGIHKGGAVNVVYGSASGPGARTSLNQDTPGVPGGSETADYFGYELSFGDINGDGRDDLVVGAPGEDLNGVADSGMVSVLYATENGFATAGNQALEQESPGVPGSGEANDRFGTEVYLADVNGDGKADLTVGTPDENNGDGQVTTFVSDGAAIDPAGRNVGLTATGLTAQGTPLLGANIIN